MSSRYGSTTFNRSTTTLSCVERGLGRDLDRRCQEDQLINPRSADFYLATSGDLTWPLTGAVARAGLSPVGRGREVAACGYGPGGRALDLGGGSRRGREFGTFVPLSAVGFRDQLCRRSATLRHCSHPCLSARRHRPDVSGPGHSVCMAQIRQQSRYNVAVC